jgi:hypothetical protein
MAQTESGLRGFIYHKTLKNVNAVTSKPYGTYLLSVPLTHEVIHGEFGAIE